MIAKNNPLNIRYSPLNKWKGMTGNTKGFCEFESVDYCIRAGLILMRSYRKRGCKTIRHIIERYAPANENDTEAYISFVAKNEAIPADAVLYSDFDYCRVLHSMLRMETGTTMSAIEIKVIASTFHIHIV